MCNMLSYAWCFNLHNNSFDIFESDYLPFLRNFFAALCAICKNFAKAKTSNKFSYTLILYIFAYSFRWISRTFYVFPFYIVYCSEFDTFHVLCGTFPLQQKFSKNRGQKAGIFHKKRAVFLGSSPKKSHLRLWKAGCPFQSGRFCVEMRLTVSAEKIIVNRCIEYTC